MSKYNTATAALIGVLLTFSLSSGLAAAKAVAPENSLFQVESLYTLEAGLFDGDFPYQKLMQKGTQGIGTFNSIDGEMIAVDGKFYQSRPDCRVVPVDPKLQAPFAEIIQFQPVVKFSVDNLADYHSIGERLSAKFPNQNLPYAIRIDGVFSEITVRSLTKQTKPYPNLLAASKQQGKLELKNVKGTAVGFWFPHYWEGIGMPGFHFHFVTADKQFGGHVLAMSVSSAQVQIQPIQNVQVYLPSTVEFANAHIPDPDTLEHDLQQVEGIAGP